MSLKPFAILHHSYVTHLSSFCTVIFGYQRLKPFENYNIPEENGDESEEKCQMVDVSYIAKL